MMADTVNINEALLDFGKTINPRDLFPVLEPEASSLIIDSPYAFAMAVCLDRQTPAEVIWTIPFYIHEDLGHLDPSRIQQMSFNELEVLFSRLPRKPRFVNDAPRTVQELTDIVVFECNGDATQIWKGKKASRVKRTFNSIYGVGVGIANMSVLLIEKAYNLRFDDIDHTNMNIKADVHTVRVLYRLGASDVQSEKAAIATARELNPDFPGEVDGPLWIIGRRWCHAYDPNCVQCPMNSVCINRI